MAGTVDALSEGVGPQWLGLRVAAHLGMVPGGYAELAVTGTGQIHALPDGLDFAEAAAHAALEDRRTMGKVVLIP